MDLLGTKRLIEIVEGATGTIIPHTEKVLLNITTALEKAQLLIIDTQDIIEDLDKVVEGLPAHIQALVKAGLSLAAAGERVVFRASGAVQSYSTGVRLNADGLQIGDFKIQGGVIVTPKE